MMEDGEDYLNQIGITDDQKKVSEFIPIIE